jgi:hypothetical protein
LKITPTKTLTKIVRRFERKDSAFKKMSWMNILQTSKITPIYTSTKTVQMFGRQRMTWTSNIEIKPTKTWTKSC